MWSFQGGLVLICFLRIAPISICTAAIAFAEYPMNTTLIYPMETVATFRCRLVSEAPSNWLINGSTYRNFIGLEPSIDIISDNGTIVDTLSITVTPEHNQTQVACVEKVSGNSVVSPSATLTIVIAFTTGSTEGSTTVTTTEESTVAIVTEKVTTAPMPTLSTINFIQIPSPSLVVVVLKSEHTFYCNHSQTTRLSWKLNGTAFDFVDLPPGTGGGSESILGGRQVYLTLKGLPEYNATRVQCVAELNGMSVETSIATFLVQGALQGVRDLTRNASTLSWEAPFSLDLIGIDVDIVYCVEVYNITCGRSLLISECDVVENNYTNDALMLGYIYEYIVTPRSNVKGASNGTSINVTEEFLVMEESLMGHSVAMMMSNITMSDLETRAILHLKVHDYDIAEDIRPALYTIFFNSLDGVETYPNFSEASAHLNGNNFMLEIAPLFFRRLWSIRVYAHDCEYHPLTDELELGTHDFHNITVISSSDNPGTIMVTGDVIPGSPSIGILVIVYSESLGNDSNIHYNMIEHTKVQQPRMYPVTTGLPVDEYKVAIFVVEEDGKPFPRAAATPRTVRINEIQPSLPASIEYEIQANFTHVCITCTFLDSATTYCVVVVHQRISQLSSSGLMNITKSHKFTTKSGNEACECIEVDMKKQQVGVIGGIRKTSINSRESHSGQCTTLCLAVTVATAVIAIASILALSIIILFIFVCISRKRQKNRLIQQMPVSMHVTAVSDDMLEPDTRYETVQLSVRTQHGHSQDEMDANSTISPPTVSGEGRPLGSAPSLPPPRFTDPAYTETVTVSGSRKVTQQPATEGVVYDDIKAFQNKDGQQYAIIGNLKTSGKVIDDPNRTVYSEIQHVHSSQQVQITDTSSQTRNTTLLTQDNDPTPKPVTLEHLLPELLPLASKWQSLGEALSLDEDKLDEIFTNDETDEACLEVMLEQYMARPYLNHSWEEIQKALKQIGEELTIDQPEVPSRGKTEAIHPELPSGEDLMGQQDTLDEEIASQKSESEERVPAEDPPQHTESQGNEDTCDASQQGSNLSGNQLEDMDKDDYPSSFDEQENELSESSNQDDGQFESGKVTSPASETASITSDNRNVYDANKSELHQRNIYAPLPFHTECGEQINKEFCDVLAPRSGTCSWSDGVDGASELVISSNWNFLHYCLHSKDT